jgi:hypothetical protein
MAANRPVILALAAALALTGPSLHAQASHRGGGGRPGGGGAPRGGGHPGGSYAVPRGGAPAHPGYSPRGGVAATRHPQAGTGRYSYHPGYGGRYPGDGGHHPRYSAGYYPRYGGYYPRYSGYYYGSNYHGYYRPYWNASLYFGWPYNSAGWWPYGYYSPSDSVSYYGYPAEAPAAQPAGEDFEGASRAPRPAASSRDVGRIRVEVRPDDASVYVDDEFWGNARETKFLTLRSGRHAIELVRPGFEVVRRDVDVVRGETADVFIELQRP